MSMLSTMAKMAAAAFVAKKLKGVLSGGSASSSSGGGLSDILGKMTKSASSQKGSVGGSGGILDDIINSSSQTQPSSGQATGGLQDILGKLTQGNNASTAQGQSPAGGLESILGGLLGGSAGASGGLGGLLDKLAPQNTSAATGSAGGLGDILNQALSKYGEPDTAPSAQQNDAAGILLSVMLQAAKSDGTIDAAEKEAIFKNLGDISAEEMAFINQQLSAPVDPQGLAATIPQGMQQQAYMMSLLAIDLDHQNEANYLHTFATALGLGQSEVNAIHQQMDEPMLYS